jgi:hypothetical protein
MIMTVPPTAASGASVDTERRDDEEGEGHVGGHRDDPTERLSGRHLVPAWGSQGTPAERERPHPVRRHDEADQGHHRGQHADGELDGQQPAPRNRDGEEVTEGAVARVARHRVPRHQRDDDGEQEARGGAHGEDGEVGRAPGREVGEGCLADTPAVSEAERGDEPDRQGHAQTPREPGGPARELPAQLQAYSETRPGVLGPNDQLATGDLARTMGHLLGHGRSPMRSGRWQS